MTTNDSPFIVGARVAIREDRFHENYSEGRIEKVHKTGRFTLVGGNGRQWSPHSHVSTLRGRVEWSAYECGDGWFRRSLRIWDASTDAEISAANAQVAREGRWNALRKRMQSIKVGKLSDPMLDAIEAVLPSESVT